MNRRVEKSLFEMTYIPKRSINALMRTSDLILIEWLKKKSREILKIKLNKSNQNRMSMEELTKCMTLHNKILSILQLRFYFLNTLV